MQSAHMYIPTNEDCIKIKQNWTVYGDAELDHSTTTMETTTSAETTPEWTTTTWPSTTWTSASTSASTSTGTWRTGIPILPENSKGGIVVYIVFINIVLTRDGHRQIRQFFPVQPENFRTVPVEKLRFFPVQPENMLAVTSVFSGYPL